MAFPVADLTANATTQTLSPAKNAETFTKTVIKGKNVSKLNKTNYKKNKHLKHKYKHTTFFTQKFQQLCQNP